MPKAGVYGPTANAAYWSLKDRRLAFELHKTLPVDKVASQIGCDPRTVWRWLKDHREGRVPLEETDG